MKKTVITFLLFLGIFAFSQQVSFETILNDKISIRAIQIWDNKIWYSGTDSKFGFVDLNNTQNQKQITLSEKKLQFRTLAQDEKYFYAINIESPAYFFRIKKKNLKSKIVFKDTLKTAFYDALHTIKNPKILFALSDPDKNKGRIAKMNIEKKSKWEFIKLDQKNQFESGEAAFAASNTNISSQTNLVWIATGGKKSRILKLNLRTGEEKFVNTPFVQGSSSQGIYSIDFFDENFGIAVGGDYTKQSDNVNNIAVTFDGGLSWKTQASGKNEGYMTCVKFRPDSPNDIIAVGDQHISYSSDAGETWKKISDEKNLYVCEWVDKNTVVFAGKDRVVKMTLHE